MTRGNQRDTDRLRAQQRAAGGAGTGKSTLGTAESTAAIMRAKQEAAMAKKAAEAAGKQPENGQVVGLKEKKAPNGLFLYGYLTELLQQNKSEMF